MRGQNKSNSTAASRMNAKANALNNKIVQSNVSANNNNNIEGTIVLPKNKDVTGVQDTIYLCNFRVSVDGEWLCLKELQDSVQQSQIEGAPKIDETTKSIVANDQCNEKIVERDWVNYYFRCFFSFSFFLLCKYLFFIHNHTFMSHTLSYDLVACARIIRCIFLSLKFFTQSRSFFSTHTHFYSFFKHIKEL